MLASLYGLGCLLYRLAPHSAASELAVRAGELLTNPAKLHPKPEERFVYFGLMLAFPLLLGAALYVANRLRPPPRPAIWDGYAVAVFVIASAIAAGLSHDVLARFSFGRGEAFSLAVLSMGMLACQRVLGKNCSQLAARSWLTIALCALAILASVASRVFDVNSVIDAPQFTVDFDAAFYPASQIAAGGTCLVDILPQYGCYGEFLAPIIKLFGSSVLTFTWTLAILQASALVAMLIYCRSLFSTANGLIGSGIFLILLCSRFFRPDLYLAYAPIRILFPAFSFLMVLLWQRRQSLPLAFCAGIFSALGCFWNLDSGAVVLAALASFVAFSGPRAKELLARVGRVLAFVGGAIAGMIAMVLLLSAKAGAWVHLGWLFVYQTVFFKDGFNMLPIPPPPQLWTVAIALAVITLTLSAIRAANDAADPRLERAGYVAVLAIGLFSYYSGRSHPEVFLLASWPFAILLLFLVERAVIAASYSLLLPIPALAWRSMAAGLTSLALVLGWQSLPALFATSVGQWSQIAAPAAPSALQQDAAFVSREVPAGEPAVILAANQATLFAQAHLRSATPGPGIIETIRRVDGYSMIDSLMQVHRHVFIGFDLCLSPAQIVYGMPCLVRRSLDRIRRTFKLVGWSPQGRLMHFVRRDDDRTQPDLSAYDYNSYRSSLPDRGTPSFFAHADASNESILSIWNRPVQFPGPIQLLDAPTQWPSEFALEMRLTPAKKQVADATLISNEDAALHGFALRRWGNDPDAYLVSLGVGTHRVESAPFQVPAEHESTILIQYAAARVFVLVNSVVRLDWLSPMELAKQPFVLGNRPQADRPFAATLAELRFYDHAVYMAAASTR